MFDTEHILKDAGAVTSSGYGEVDSTAKVVDLGEGLVRGNLHIDISAIDISDGDEKYAEQEALERLDVTFQFVAIFTVRQHHAGQECAECGRKTHQGH